jgi:hypothetical protein
MNDDKLKNQVRQLLDESVAGLDDATCRRLQQARQRALAVGESRRSRRWWLWGGMPAMATALLLLLVWSQQETATKGLLPVPDLFEPGLLAMEEPLDFYQEEVEFYEWLAEVLETDQVLAPGAGKLGAPFTGVGRVHPPAIPVSAGRTESGTGTARVPRHV